MSTSLIPKPLFGGSIQIDLPTNAQDVSEFRQVPDNQEVFVNPSNNQSVSIDIFEAVSATGITEAVNTHFEELVRCNCATDAAVDSIEIQNISDGVPMVLLRGRQKVAKFNRQEPDLVRVSIMLYRFTQHSSDILVCLNDPIMVHEHGDVSATGRWSEDSMLACLRSLKLLDPGIFGAGS